jgi:hypothetical protein
MPARCSQCGNTVMPYRRYLFYMGRSPVKCAHCGTEVRLRHFRTLVYGSIAVGSILALAAVLLTPSIREFEVTIVALCLVGVAADYWSWRALPWDPAQPSRATTPPPLATS